MCDFIYGTILSGLFCCKSQYLLIPTIPAFIYVIKQLRIIFCFYPHPSIHFIVRVAEGANIQLNFKCLAVSTNFSTLLVLSITVDETDKGDRWAES